jgi:hypothetical protein
MIETFRNNRKVEYYTKDDCPHKFVYWKELQEDGWCSTDDDYIVYAKVKEIVEIRGSNTRVRRRIQFPFGCRYAHGQSRYDFLQALENKGSGLLSRHWVDNILIAEPGMIEVFAQMVLAGKLPFNNGRYKYTKEEYEVFYAMSEYFFKSNNQWRQVRTIFNHDRIRGMIQKKIDANLLKRGIDVDKVFELIEEAKIMGQTHVDKMGNVGIPGVLLQVADKYAGLIGMSGKKTLGDGDGHKPDELPGAERTYDNIINETIPEAIIITEENK